MQPLCQRPAMLRRARTASGAAKSRGNPRREPLPLAEISSFSPHFGRPCGVDGDGGESRTSLTTRRGPPAFLASLLLFLSRHRTRQTSRNATPVRRVANRRRRSNMLSWSITFLIIALVAAVLG